MKEKIDVEKINISTDGKNNCTFQRLRSKIRQIVAQTSERISFSSSTFAGDESQYCESDNIHMKCKDFHDNSPYNTFRCQHLIENLLEFFSLSPNNIYSVYVFDRDLKIDNSLVLSHYCPVKPFHLE